MNFPKLHPKDYMAILLVLLIFLLIIVKANHSLDAILTLIIGYYFGHRRVGIDTGE